MLSAIIGGTGVYGIPGGVFTEEIMVTPFGKAKVYRGEGEYADLVFLARHGVNHSVPPHKINYKANIKALSMLGVKNVLATFAVGSLRESVPPLGLVALDQFLDFTSGRDFTFYEGGKWGFDHCVMTHPYCTSLRKRLLEVAKEKALPIQSAGTYVCTNGPRLETAAEVRMYAQLGGDVVGMTGVPEAPLARELGLHYAAVAFSINWCAGLKSEVMEMHEDGLEALKASILDLFITTLRSVQISGCECEHASLGYHPHVEEEE